MNRICSLVLMAMACAAGFALQVVTAQSPDKQTCVRLMLSMLEQSIFQDLRETQPRRFRPPYLQVHRIADPRNVPLLPENSSCHPSHSYD